jgi:hypothetical protein
MEVASIFCLDDRPVRSSLASLSGDLKARLMWRAGLLLDLRWGKRGGFCLVKERAVSRLSESGLRPT